MANINDTYFDGLYKDIWKAIIPAELTAKEVDYIVNQFGLSAGSRVLDMMCGYGRHALGLAAKGIPVTAVDNLEAYTSEISAAATAQNLPVTVLQSDIASFSTNDKFDLAICMGNSLNFFSEPEIESILKSTAASLKPGGGLLINSWSIAEIAIPQFKERAWSKLDNLKLIAESKYLFNPTRIETEQLIIDGEGKIETKQAVDYIFSLAEMSRILQSCGFRMDEAYSIPGRKKFSLGDPRVYIVATRI